MIENEKLKDTSGRRWLLINTAISGLIWYILVFVLIEVTSKPDCFDYNDVLLPFIFFISAPIMLLSAWICWWINKRDLSTLFSIILFLISLGSCFVMFVLAGGLLYCGF